MIWYVKRLWTERKPALILLLLFSLLTGLLTPLIVRYEKELIDALQAALSGSGWDASILIPVLILLACYGISYSLPSLGDLLHEKLRASGENALSRRHLEKLQRIEYRSLEDPATVDLISRISEKIDSVSGGFMLSCFSLLSAAISVAGFFAFVCSASWVSGIVFLGLFCLLLFFADRSAKGMYALNQHFSEVQRRVMYLDKVVNGRDTAHEKKLFGFTGYVGRLRSEYLLSKRDAQRRYERKYAVAFSLIDTAGYLCTILMMLSMLPAVRSQAMSIGVFIAASHAALNLNLTVQNQILSNLNQILNLRGFWKDCGAFLALPEQESASGGSAPPALQSIEFRNVSFRYKPDAPYVLRQVNFRMEPGRHYALVGENGSGKSTIVKLLLRLYDVEEGEILLNGRDIRTYSSAQLSGLYSAVFQDFSRYYVSLLDNITFGQKTDPRELADTLRLTRADSIAEKVGADTLLGDIYEPSRNLSGGEWQRVAFARALHHNGEVLLLDEPTSALDPISENEIYSQFSQLSAHKTTLFITHRLASTRMADEILVLDGGRIAEQGSHTDLLERGGLYARMYESQKKWYRKQGEDEVYETA